MAIATWIRLVLSGIGVFVSSWIVIPAPNRFLLPLGVGAPEVSPLLFLANGIALLLAVLPGKPSLVRAIAIGLSMVGLVLSSLPLLQLPATLEQAAAMMQTTLGQNYLGQVPDTVKSKMRPQPIDLATLFRGLPVAALQPDRTTISAGDGTPLQLEIYRADRQGLQPTLISIYGGAWLRGQPEDTRRFNQYMAAQGYTVVAIDYRHAPQHRFPAQLQDVRQTLEFLQQNAARYGIDRDRLALVGWSAGGHLALLAGYQPDALPVRAIVGYYSPIDLTAGYFDLPNPDPIHTRQVLQSFLGSSPDHLPDLYKQASPISFVQPGLPPTLLLQGQRDHLVKPVFAQTIYDRLQATGNTAVLIKLPWAEHAFDVIFPGIGNQIALYYTERFLAWALRR
ncbi:MAG: alpha/beta hydrolase [Leptolyngbyaceae cyanobacterium bins.59]|nr:alpha/beta hydrolase [Leptolyngbyaceae cyanobacterium bins.59]